MEEKSLADKFIDEVIEAAYWQMPKEYRQFEFQELDKGEQFEIAIGRIGFGRFKSLLEKCIQEAESCNF
jgi:hypothetical protein